MTAPLGPGSVLGGRYRLTRVMGRGAFGEVYEARDMAEGWDVAVKLLKQAASVLPGAEERFAREMRLTGRLTHPLVVRALGSGYQDGQAFLVMELAEGTTLARRLAESRLPQEKGSAIVADILTALGHAHALGIIHRDVKPSNVMLSRDDRARLMDFGLAKLCQTLMATPLTQQLPIGTPSYMSPEQARGEEVDHRSDLFSAGLVAFEILTGRRAYPGPPSAVLLRIQGEPLPATPELGHALAAWLARACAKSPSERFQSAEAMRSELVSQADAGSPLAQASMETGAIEARVVTTPLVSRPLPREAVATPSPLSRLPRRSLAWIGAAAALGLLASISIGVLALALRNGLGRTLALPPSTSTVERPSPPRDSATPTPAPRQATPVQGPRVTVPEPTPSPTPEEYGILAVHSMPEGAGVFADGHPQGITPLDVKLRLRVAHDLSLSMPGYEKLEVPRYQLDRQSEKLTVTLSRLPAVATPTVAAPTRVPPEIPKETPDPARALFLKLIDGLGGAARVDGTRDQFQIATTDGGAKQTDRVLLPDHVRSDVESPQGSFVLVWSPDRKFMRRGSREVDLPVWGEQDLSSAIRRSPVVIAQHRDDPALRIVRAGNAAIGGIEAGVIDVTWNGLLTTFAVDPESGKLLREEYQSMGPDGWRRVRIDFSDFRLVEGGWVSYSQHTSFDGKAQPAVRIVQYDTNVGLTPGDFD